jgi:Skp family chaperone for outer membrane proteins
MEVTILCFSVSVIIALGVLIILVLKIRNEFRSKIEEIYKNIENLKAETESEIKKINENIRNLRSENKAYQETNKNLLNEIIGKNELINKEINSRSEELKHLLVEPIDPEEWLK